MKYTGFLLMIFAFFYCGFALFPSETSSPISDDPMTYLGQKRPGTTPEKFAPGIVSIPNRYEFGSTFSKDGKEMFLGIDTGNGNEIHYMHLTAEGWSEPVNLFKGSGFSVNDPMLSPDEQRLYFISPSHPSGTRKDYDIWYAERKGAGWSQPINAGKNINTTLDEYYISFTEEGTMYFATRKPIEADNIPGRPYNFDIVRSEFRKGAFLPPETLPTQINTDHYEADVYVAPDESYMIFCAIRPDGKGRGDLYISFKDGKGQWTPSVNMDLPINTTGHELCPFVSADGKYFFYTGNKDIYWVSTEIFENYR
ncbi:MAG: hypothetical protein AAFQ83_23815 [Bacteroidota bacterium]